MKKFFASIAVFVAAFFVFSVGSVSAKVLTSQNGEVVVAKDEIINDDLFVGAQTVQIDGTVNGDVFIGAQTTKITGVINGNLHVGANTIDLSGTVRGNVYAGAQSIFVSGSSIGGSLLIGAGTINVDKDSQIGGSIIAGAGVLSIDSQIKRSVYAGTENLTIGADALIGKDLYYASGDKNHTNISNKAKVTGSVYKSEVDTMKANAKVEAAKKNVPQALNAAKVFTTLISLVGALVVGFLYMKFFNKSFVDASETVSRSFWKSLGIGFLVTIAFIPGIIVLLMTIIGIPVAGLSILIMLLYTYLAKIVVGSALGKWVSAKFNWRTSEYGVFALGLLVIYVLKSIPFLGFLTGLVVLWSGLGALTLQIFSKSN